MHILFIESVFQPVLNKIKTYTFNQGHHFDFSFQNKNKNYRKIYLTCKNMLKPYLLSWLRTRTSVASSEKRSVKKYNYNILMAAFQRHYFDLIFHIKYISVWSISLVTVSHHLEFSKRYTVGWKISVINVNIVAFVMTLKFKERN